MTAHVDEEPSSAAGRTQSNEELVAWGFTGPPDAQQIRVRGTSAVVASGSSERIWRGAKLVRQGIEEETASGCVKRPVTGDPLARKP